MHWLAQAPSNIALIKYMGKKDSTSNLPDNASLSYTLGNLISTVRLELLDKGPDRWEPLPLMNSHPFSLSQKAQDRFIKHFQRIKEEFEYSGSFLIQSANNFPHGSGLASSASSFAALTRVAVEALSALTKVQKTSIERQAYLSRLGSGSSCRSFYSPWALWQENEVRAINLPYQDLLHEVVVISTKEKEVSSSEAHSRVRSSSDYQGRAERAEKRLSMLVDALQEKNWSLSFKICWEEFHDMHNLFVNCANPFNYITQDSKNILKQLNTLWLEKGDGPLVTMDAGPNIHLLYRPDQIELAKQFKAKHLAGKYHVL